MIGIFPDSRAGLLVMLGIEHVNIEDTVYSNYPIVSSQSYISACLFQRIEKRGFSFHGFFIYGTISIREPQIQ